MPTDKILIEVDVRAVADYLAMSREERDTLNTHMSNLREAIRTEQLKLRDARLIHETRFAEHLANLSPEGRAAVLGQTFTPTSIESRSAVGGLDAMKH